MKISVNSVELNVREEGDPKGAPVVFANSLGTDLTLWDGVVPLLVLGCPSTGEFAIVPARITGAAAVQLVR